MTVSSDVPQILRVAVEWLKVEDLCEYLPDLDDARAPHLWPHVLLQNYAGDWWRYPGGDPTFLNSWDQAYHEDLDRFKRQVRTALVPRSIC